VGVVFLELLGMDIVTVTIDVMVVTLAEVLVVVTGLSQSAPGFDSRSWC
jgi:hypothetical protein